MNERTLSRGLSTSVVDTLKAHGHVLVVKGGAAALAREMEELIAPAIAVIAPRLGPRGLLSDEPTSTFADETIDQAVEDLVARLARALMSSDHVEDVFAEDAVIRRDIFRAMQAGLLEPGEGAPEDATTVTVKLDTLGYVASTVSKRADAAVLRDALERAGAVARARLTAYSPDLREATFHLEGAGDDEGLELEEAVADELADLAEQGVTPLPMVERRIDLGRALSAAEQRALRPRLDATAEATLGRSGCATAWDFEGARVIRITFTPLSDQDARGVDAPASAFAREVLALLTASAAPTEDAPRPAPTAAPAEKVPEAAPSRRKAARVKEAPEEEPSVPAAPPTLPESKPATRAKKTAKRAAGSEPAAKAPKARTAKKTAKRAAESEPAAKAPKARTAKKTASAPKSSAKRGAVTKTTKTSAKKG